MSTRIRKATRLAVLASALALSAAAALPPSPSSASALDVTCTPPTSTVVAFNPALTATPQTTTVSVSTQYGPCISAGTPTLTSGTAGFQAPAPGWSCHNLLQAFPSTFTITWNTGQTSTISGNATSTITGGALVYTLTGTVTSGLFTGDTVLQTSTAPATNILLCTLGVGSVSSIYSLVTLAITST